MDLFPRRNLTFIDVFVEKLLKITNFPVQSFSVGFVSNRIKSLLALKDK